MSKSNRVLHRIWLVVICGLFATGSVLAQDDEREERDKQKTKQAQAVSKEVYDHIQKAQEEIDAENYNEGLRLLEALKTRKGISEYELQNVLNYIGFVHYNLDDIDAAMAAYQEMINIPSIEPQIKKNTIYTMAQFSMMQEK